MKKFVRSFVAAIISVSVLSVVAITGSSSALASTVSATSAWTGYDQTALGAASAYGGLGTISMTTSPSEVTLTNATTPSGQIPVAQETIVASSSSGTVVLVVALLGGTQLVVNVLSESTGGQGTALVLQPGTSSVIGTYPLSAPTVTATTAATRAVHEAHTADAVVRRAGAHRHHARLETTGGCYPAPYAPVVISSTFGPLIDGLGVIRCLYAETLSLIVAIYKGFTRQGTQSGGSGGGTWYGINAYAVCSHISGTHTFRTSQLWAVNGVLQGGATSSNAALHCQ